MISISCRSESSGGFFISGGAGIGLVAARETNAAFAEGPVRDVRQLNERVLQMPKLFPAPDVKNLVICVAAPGFNTGFAELVGAAAAVVDLHNLAHRFRFP